MAYGTIANARLLSGLTITDVADATLTSLITLSDAEVEQTTGQKYGSQAVTEYYSIYTPKTVDSKTPNRLLLKHYPIVEITDFTLIDTTSSAYATLDVLTAAEIAAGTYNSANYFCEPSMGLIELFSYTFDFAPKRAKITYTYGYASTPTLISELSSNIAAMMALIQFLGGKYDKANKYSVPEQSYDRGDFYARGKQQIDTLAARTDYLYGLIGKKFSSQIAVTSASFF